jgi:hypothetical protein
MLLRPCLRQCHTWHSLKPAQISRACYSTKIKQSEPTWTSEPIKGNHRDLASFLEYASHGDLDPKSSVYIGTHYEYIVQSSLQRLGISLKRVGGRSDHGIDLLGAWNLPAVPSPLKVLIQCKARAVKPSPAQVRELEGAFVGAPSGWRGSRVLALLISQKPATKGVRDALGRSRWPMGFVMCTDQGKILQMLWNRRAEDEGLLGVGVTLRYAEEGRDDREVVLTWQGKTLGDQATD